MIKFCVIPGREPVRLASTDGNIVIIGSIPRPIPEQFVSEAKAAGCLTEEELKKLKDELGAVPEPTPEPEPTAGPGRPKKSIIME